MEKKQALPEYLKQLRRNHGYKQKDIALQLGITRQTYSHYETGRVVPSVHVLYRLAKIYGISVDDILVQAEMSGKNTAIYQGQFQEIDQMDENLFPKEFLACFRSLTEKDRQETLSIMWEIMQVKKTLGRGCCVRKDI